MPFTNESTKTAAEITRDILITLRSWLRANVITGKIQVKEVIEFWRTQQYHLPAVAHFFDMNPSYHNSREFEQNTNKGFINSVTKLVELYSNMKSEL